MKKLMIMLTSILATATIFGAPANMKPAETGSTPNGSWVKVRVTANVVEGIAVNEASPIDFGNLVKDNYADKGNPIYQNGEKIRDITHGRVIYRANTIGYNTFTTKLETDRIDLDFVGSSGVEDEVSTNTKIKNVKIDGIGTTSEDVTLVNGQGERQLTAWFVAYNGTSADKANGVGYTIDYVNGNLGKQQKLGNYEGTVKVIAESKANRI